MGGQHAGEGGFEIEPPSVNETLMEPERAAMELLGPLEKALMASLLDLGWKIGMEPERSGPSQSTGPKLSFISPTNQVFSAWEEVTNFFDKTGKQEGWLGDSAGGRKSGHSITMGSEIAEDPGGDPEELGFWEQGADGVGLTEPAVKETRPPNGVSQLLGNTPEDQEVHSVTVDHSPLVSQKAPSLEPTPRITLEGGPIAPGGSGLNFELTEGHPSLLNNVEKSLESFWPATTNPSAPPVAAAKRSPLPPPLALSASGPPPPPFLSHTPAESYGERLNMEAVAGREVQGVLTPHLSVSPVGANSKGGFIYERKDGVKVYHQKACKCRGCNAKRKNGEVPENAPAPQGRLLEPEPSKSVQTVLPSTVIHGLLPWEIPERGEAAPVVDELTAVNVAAVQSLELQGIELPACTFGGVGEARGMGNQFAEDEYFTPDEASPHESGGEVSLQGGIGYQNIDTGIWERSGGQEEDEEGEDGSDVEDLDLFIPRIMEQTGFTPILTGQEGFMGFGPSAYAAMQAVVPPEDSSALVLYEATASELENHPQEGQFPEGGGTTRKRNAYLCKRCGQIKKGHTCNPSAPRTSSRLSSSHPPTPDQTPSPPVLLKPPPPPAQATPPPRPPERSPTLQPYSFSSFPSPSPPLLDDLQSFFSPPREEAPPAANPSTSERAVLPQNIGYKPSKAASATAILAAGGQGRPCVVVPKYKDPPTNARLLLATGLLEGQHVSYVMQSGKLLLSGWIKGGGVVCECQKCQGKALVSLSEFEKHAGSVARHPSDYIFLDDGRNLRQLVEDAQAIAAGRLVASQELVPWVPPGGAELDAPVEGACSACGEEGNVTRCSACSREYHPECVGLERPPSASASWTCPRCQGSKGRGIYRGPPIARLLKASPATIRRRTPSNVFNVLFLENGLPDGEAVSYRIRGETILRGKKARGGIECSCCGMVVSPSTFEQHAGKGARRNPYTSIFVDSADVHLKDYANRMEAQGGPKNDGDAEPDECAECGDGGKLILCDGCPKAYHPECVRLTDVPKGDWFCGGCDKPRIAAAKTKAALRQGGGEGEGAASEILARCQRLLTEVDTTTGGCILCRLQDFSKSFGDRTIILCDQCEREFHVGCLRQHGVADLTELPEGDWFCCDGCERISEALQGFVEQGQQPIPDYQMKGGKAVGDGRERTWQLLRGRQGSKDKGKVLAAAVDILSKCFDPIIDGASGEDLLPMMVHSRQTKDHDFSGMYCIALRSGNKVASVAVVRIFGNKLAEMPLIATSLDARRQGHCRALMTATEWLLASLGVARLSLPAAEGAEDTWQTGFGFTKMSHADLQRWRAELQALLVFPGASMLEKAIVSLPGVTRPQPSPPSMHPRPLSRTASGEGGVKRKGRAIEDALAEAAEAHGGGVSKGKRSKTSKSEQGALSAGEEASGPATSSHSAEEDGFEAPIMVKFSRKKQDDVTASDSAVPIASMLPESQASGKRKRGRPPGSKVEKRGRPRKEPGEGDGRQEEPLGESKAESADLGADLGADGSEETASKKRKIETGRAEMDLENGPTVSPLQLQKEALRHTRPRSMLGKSQGKGNTEEGGADSKAGESGATVPMTREEKTRKFLESVQKHKDKKQRRKEAGERLRAAKVAKGRGADVEAGGVLDEERKVCVSEASSRSTGGVKGPRSKRRARVFVEGKKFWLPVRENVGAQDESRARPAKKLRTVVGEEGVGEKEKKSTASEGGERDVAQGEAPSRNGISTGVGKKETPQRKVGVVKEGADKDVPPGAHLVRVLARNLEPHTGGQANGQEEKKQNIKEKAQQLEGQTEDSGEVDKKPDSQRLKSETRKKRDSSKVVENETGANEGESDEGLVKRSSCKEGTSGKGSLEQSELEEGETVRERDRRRGKGRLGARDTQEMSETATKSDPRTASQGVESRGNGDPPMHEVPEGGGQAQVRKGQKGMRGVTLLALNGRTPQEPSLQEGRRGAADADRSTRLAGGVAIDKDLVPLGKDVSAEGGAGKLGEERRGKVYHRRKGRGPEEKEEERGQVSNPPGEPIEKEVTSGGSSEKAAEEVGQENGGHSKRKPSGLIVKGVKGFQKKKFVLADPPNLVGGTTESNGAGGSGEGSNGTREEDGTIEGRSKQELPPNTVEGAETLVIDGPSEQAATREVEGHGTGDEEETGEVTMGGGKSKRAKKERRRGAGKRQTADVVVGVPLLDGVGSGNDPPTNGGTESVQLNGCSVLSESEGADKGTRGQVLGDETEGKGGGRTSKADESGAEKETGRKGKVSRELQALQEAVGGFGLIGASKRVDAFAGFVSSTRQRVR